MVQIILQKIEEILNNVLYKIKSSRLVPEREIYSDTSSLSRVIFLRKRALLTTQNAVVLHSEPHKRDDDFLSAYRIIHGPGIEMTTKPYIILYNTEADYELQDIVESLLVHYPDDFPDIKDSYLVPICYLGEYLDKRIRWYTF